MAKIQAGAPVRLLSVLAAVVLLLHVLLLPSSFAAFSAAEPVAPHAFVTRTIEATGLPAVPVLPVLRKARAVVKATPRPVNAPVYQRKSHLALEEIAPVAINSGGDVSVDAASTLVAAAVHESSHVLAPAASSLALAARPAAVKVPDAVRLKYDVIIHTKGLTNHADGDLQWQHDGTSYSARLEIRHLLLGARTQTSQGQITPQGLAPTRFSDKVRSEVAAHFERDKGRIIFSANTPDAPLLPGAQDRLSVFLQLAALLAGAPDQFPTGREITLAVVGPRAADSWHITVDEQEALALPGGQIIGLKLVRNPQQDYDQKLELWLAPSMGYLPVRIRLTEANGDVADQRWQATQVDEKP